MCSMHTHYTQIHKHTPPHTKTLHANTHTCTHIYGHTCKHIYKHTYAYTLYTKTLRHIYTDIHTYTQTYTHTTYKHTHTHTWRGEVGGCWSFREVGCSFLVVLFKETRRKTLNSEMSISVYPLSFLSYLVIGSEAKEIKDGNKKNPQSSKDQLQWRAKFSVHIEKRGP